MKSQTGFTLIELLVGVALLAIISTYALPNLIDFIRNNKLVANTNEVVSNLNVARAEAIKRHMTVTVCGSSSGTSCDTSIFENGWIAFTDTNADGVVDAGVDEILIVHNALNDNTIRAVGFTNAGRVQYSSRGVIDSTGSFVICDTRGNKHAKAVNINVTGRIRAATDDSGSGIVNGSDGMDVTCP